MAEPLQLSLGQRFEKERLSRVINESKDIEALRKIALTLMDGWFSQRAATQWVMRQSLSMPPTVTPEALRTNAPESREPEQKNLEREHNPD
jgi:hypothetical protein